MVPTLDGNCFHSFPFMITSPILSLVISFMPFFEEDIEEDESWVRREVSEEDDVFCENDKDVIQEDDPLMDVESLSLLSFPTLFSIPLFFFILILNLELSILWTLNLVQILVRLHHLFLLCSIPFFTRHFDISISSFSVTFLEIILYPLLLFTYATFGSTFSTLFLSVNKEERKMKKRRMERRRSRHSDPVIPFGLWTIKPCFTFPPDPFLCQHYFSLPSHGLVHLIHCRSFRILFLPSSFFRKSSSIALLQIFLFFFPLLLQLWLIIPFLISTSFHSIFLIHLFRVFFFLSLFLPLLFLFFTPSCWSWINTEVLLSIPFPWRYSLLSLLHSLLSIHIFPLLLSLVPSSLLVLLKLAILT